MASDDMFSVALQRWRRKGEDPSGDFRLAIGDAVELAKYIERVEYDHDRSSMMVILHEVKYAQYLINEPIDAESRRLTAVPTSERSRPTVGEYYAKNWTLVFDDMVFELVERFEVPAEWDAFSDWLAEHRQPKNYINTMQAYKAIVHSVKSNDAKELALWVKKAHTNFNQRSSKGTRHWGGSELKDLIVDFRLGALLKSAAKVDSSVMKGIESPHLWRWG